MAAMGADGDQAEQAKNSQPDERRRRRARRRVRLRAKRKTKQGRLHQQFQESMCELFFLQKHDRNTNTAPVAEKFTQFRAQPNPNYLQFLRSNSAPSEVMSRAMERAGVKLPAQPKPAKTKHTQKKKKVHLAPLALGLPPPPPQSLTPFFVQRSISSSESVSPAVKEALRTKMRAEAFVLRRTQELGRAGEWAPARLPKVAERQRPKTHWDGLLDEMQWLAVDFYQERQWKKNAARLLAHSAKAFVESWPKIRARADAERVRHQRKKAAFVAGRVRNFWAVVEKKRARIQQEEEEEPENVNSRVVENGVVDSSSEEDDDDESTISEQERHERTNVVKKESDLAEVKEEPMEEEQQEDEIKALQKDSQIPVEDLIPEDYFLVLACERQEAEAASSSEIKKEQEEEMISTSDAESEELSSDSDDASSIASSFASYPGSDLLGDLDALPEPLISAHLLPRLKQPPRRPEERVRRVSMRPRQKRLYDDYLAEPSTRSSMEKGDVRDIAAILGHLRKICNHPRLVEHQEHLRFSRRFPRIPDTVTFPKLATSPLQKQREIASNLRDLNLVYLSHDLRLSALASDQIRRLSAPKRLIEELGSEGGPKKGSRAQQIMQQQPRVPQGRFKRLEVPSNIANHINCRTLLPRPLDPSSSNMVTVSSSYSSSSSTSTSTSSPSPTSSPESLRSIARHNERRCHAMPLYGQDLLALLTVLGESPPALMSRGSGLARCLRATRGQGDYRCSSETLSALVVLSKLALEEARELHVRLLQAAVPVSLTPGWSREVRAMRRTVEPALGELAQKYKLPIKRSLSIQVQPDLEYGRFDHTSAKLLELENLLKDIRARREKAIIFCEMDDLLYLVRQFLHRRHHPFIYLGQTQELEREMGGRTGRLRALARFAKTSDHCSLLCSARARPPGRLGALLAPDAVRNVVLVDSSAAGMSVATREVKRWCKVLQKEARYELQIHHLVCTNSLEDNLSRPSLQQKMLAEEQEADSEKQINSSTSEDEVLWKIKRRTLEDLFGFKFGGSDSRPPSQASEPTSSSPPNHLQPPLLNWLWSNQGGDPKDYIQQLSQMKKKKRQESAAFSDEDDGGEEEEDLEYLDDAVDNDDLDYVAPIAMLQEIDEKRLKPLEKFGLRALRSTSRDPSLLYNNSLSDDDSDLHPIPNTSKSLDGSGDSEILNGPCAKLTWELSYQTALSDLAAELEYLTSLPCLTYNSEDAHRTWHGRDGQPMPSWNPPGSARGDGDLVEQYISFLYKNELMDESELPPIYIKKEEPAPPMPMPPTQPPPMAVLTAGAQKRTAAEAGLASLEPTPPGLLPSGSIPNVSPGVLGAAGLVPGGVASPYNDIKPSKLMRGSGVRDETLPPRSLFDRPTPQLAKMRRDKKTVRVTAPTLPGAPLNPAASVAGLRHPLPRPQVDADNAPEWLIQEDWALLHAVRDLLDLPLNLVVLSPAHTPNWDLVSDMVNAVSRVYRGPRQCKARYETIILPREEGRIHYDPLPPPPGVQLPTAPNLAMSSPNMKKNNKKAGKGMKSMPNLKGGNRAMKTSQLFHQDNNSTWSTLFSARFESIKAVANNRTPTMKPKLPRTQQDARMEKNAKHAAVLQEQGISYEAPLNPIRVAVNRADRIQKEKLKTQEQQQAMAQQQRAAQTAAQQAQQAAAATAQRVAAGTPGIVQPQQQQAALVPAAVPAVIPVSQAAVVAQQQQQQQAQSVVVGIQPNTAAVAAANGRPAPQVIVQGSPINRLQLAQQPQPQQVPTAVQAVQQLQHAAPHTSTMVVTSQPTAVVSVASLTPSQLQTIKNQASVGLVSAAGKRLTQEQINILRQQAMQKKNAQQDPSAFKAAGAHLTATAGRPGTVVTAAGLHPGQKVSLAVTAGLQTVSSVVVTQALSGVGQAPKALIRQLTSTAGVSGAQKTTNVRSLNENEMRVLLASSKQGLTAAGKQQFNSIAIQGQQGITAAQLLQHPRVQLQPASSGMGGTQIATIVKTVSATSAEGQAAAAAAAAAGQPHQPGGQNVAIPVGSMPSNMVRAIRSGHVTTANPQQMQMIQKQLLQQQQQRNAAIAAAQGKGQVAGTIVTAAAGQQKVTFSQVQGGKTVPAQLIVSSGAAGGQKTLPAGVTVQQIQQLVNKPGMQTTLAQLGGTQQLIPHAMLKQGAAGGQPGQTMQARVIPVSAASGRTGQIQVVAASPGTNPAVVAALAGRNAATTTVGQPGRPAPNVTIDPSGLPATVTSSQLATALGGSHIKVTTAVTTTPSTAITGAGQQQLFTTTYGQPVSVAVRNPMVTTQHGQQVMAAAQQQKLQVVTTAAGQIVSAAPAQPPPVQQQQQQPQPTTPSTSKEQAK